MAALEPTYYDLRADIKGGGINQGDLHKAIYNLERAIYAICNNIDDDVGAVGTDYMSKIGTDLRTAMTKLRTPVGGPVT